MERTPIEQVMFELAEAGFMCRLQRDQWVGKEGRVIDGGFELRWKLASSSEGRFVIATNE